MELTTRLPGLPLALLDALVPALNKRLGACPSSIERPGLGNDRLLHDIGIPSFGMLNEPERRYAADLFARYGKLD